MIGTFDVVKTDAEENKTMAELLKEGQFDIKVNNEQYTVYPDYTHLTKGQYEHARHRSPFVKGMISDQIKSSMLEENKGSLDLTKVTDRNAFNQKVMKNYLKNGWQFTM